MTPPASPTECAALLRGATNQYARAALRNRLARAVRTACFEMLMKCSVPESAAEDYTNDLAFDLVCRIERGEITPGREESYINQCARNRARDHFRQQSGVVSRFALDEDLDAVPASTDPEALLLLIEHEEETRAAAHHVRERLQEAPARYREYLTAVYLEGTHRRSRSRRGGSTCFGG